MNSPVFCHRAYLQDSKQPHFALSHYTGVPAILPTRFVSIDVGLRQPRELRNETIRELEIQNSSSNNNNNNTLAGSANKVGGYR